MLEYEDLVDIPVMENGEELVELNGLSHLIICCPVNADMESFTGGRMLLRRGAAVRLVDAAARLAGKNAEARLVVGYAYRSPALQERYFSRIWSELSAREPELEDSGLRRRVHRLVASPDVAGHPAGAAVDVTISRGEEDLDMGTLLLDLRSDAIPTFSPKVSNEQRANRMLLRRVMMESGFAPFDGEWWHFSYGDREWAAYYRKAFAFYGLMRTGTW